MHVQHWARPRLGKQCRWNCNQTNHFGATLDTPCAMPCHVPPLSTPVAAKGKGFGLPFLPKPHLPPLPPKHHHLHHKHHVEKVYVVEKVEPEHNKKGHEHHKGYEHEYGFGKHGL